ncbi:MAG: OmpA family protein [Kangiellaceae bacterium]|nr:OmpA family protein [Kangiellaceae bacterium]
MNKVAKAIYSIATLGLISLSLSMPSAPTNAVEVETDHVLVKPYDGSTLRRKNVQEFDRYSAFLGMDETLENPLSLPLEGKVSKLYYSHPKERSIFEIFENYKQALSNAGAKVLYQCDQRKYECAKNYAGPTLQKVSGINSITNLVGSYLLAKLEKSDQVAYVAIAVGQQFTDIHVIEITQMDKGMASLDASALATGLDANGYVIVNGIFFDSNKASIKDTSNKAIEQVAMLLKSRPEMNIYIVGHTDMQGAFDFNMTLSKDRANTVLEVLASNFLIERTRMGAQGLGPLSPQASNKNKDGRSKNRRVVIVMR